MTDAADNGRPGFPREETPRLDQRPVSVLERRLTLSDMALVPPPTRNGTARRSVLDEFPAARTSRRPAPVRRLASALEDRGHPVSLSLQSKILVSHFLLAMVLVGTLHLVRNASWAVQGLVAGALTLVLALLLPAVLARVTRLRSLSRSALDISRGDLASPVTTEPSLGRDEIDELSTAIGNMMAKTERVDRPSLALAPDPGVARRSRDPSPAPSSLLGLGRDRGAIFRSTHSVSAMRRRLF